MRHQIDSLSEAHPHHIASPGSQTNNDPQAASHQSVQTFVSLRLTHAMLEYKFDQILHKVRGGYISPDRNRLQKYV
jgi:hypothetical protein